MRFSAAFTLLDKNSLTLLDPGATPTRSRHFSFVIPSSKLALIASNKPRAPRTAESLPSRSLGSPLSSPELFTLVVPLKQSTLTVPPLFFLSKNCSHDYVPLTSPFNVNRIPNSIFTGPLSHIRTTIGCSHSEKTIT